MAVRRLTPEELARIDTITRNLYETMPGAEPPPMDERGKLWGEVESTQHYEFCNSIASLIVTNYVLAVETKT